MIVPSHSLFSLFFVQRAGWPVDQTPFLPPNPFTRFAVRHQLRGLKDALTTSNGHSVYSSDKRPGDLLHAWRRHHLRTLCRAIPRWTSRFELHALLLVGGMRRRSQQDRLHLLSRRNAMSLRKTL
jgi:hypothetical protein